MTPDRFQQIEELYQAAYSATAEERAALLARTDPELRREVELLLSQPTSAGFLDRPAIQNAPELLDEGTVTQIGVGLCLGPYRGGYADSFGDTSEQGHPDVNRPAPRDWPASGG